MRMRMRTEYILRNTKSVRSTLSVIWSLPIATSWRGERQEQPPFRPPETNGRRIGKRVFRNQLPHYCSCMRNYLYSMRIHPDLQHQTRPAEFMYVQSMYRVKPRHMQPIAVSTGISEADLLIMLCMSDTKMAVSKFGWHPCTMKKKKKR